MTNSLSFLSGTASLAALAALIARRGRAEQVWLQVFLGTSAAWLIGMLFLPWLHTAEWHVYHECWLAFCVVAYITQRSTLSWYTLASVCMLGAVGWLVCSGEPRSMYRGLIFLDLAGLMVLLSQRGAQQRIHAHATVGFGLVMATGFIHHAAWEVNALTGRYAGRLQSALFCVAVLMIARAAFRDAPAGVRFDS